MKTLMTLILSIFFAKGVFAGTINEKKAEEIVSILRSPEVIHILAQSNSYFRGIRYVFSGKSLFGPARYELSLVSNTGEKIQNCTIRVDLNIQSREVMAVFPATCE